MAFSLPTDPHDAQARLEAVFVNPEDVSLWVAPDIVETMQRCFPEVTIMWHAELKRWWLVQTLRDGRRVPFRMIGTIESYEEPTYSNTVDFVGQLADAMSSPRKRSEWLAEIDASSEVQSVERDARERIRAGARDLYPRLFTNRIMVPRPRDLLAPGSSPGKSEFPWARKRRSGRWASN